MAIVGPLPNQILDGQEANALPVMQDLQYIADQVNANAQPIGATSGTLVGVNFASTSNLSTGVAYHPFLSGNGICTTIVDALGEYSAINGIVTVTNTGYYFVQAQLNFNAANAAFTSCPVVDILKNNGSSGQSRAGISLVNGTISGQMTVVISGVLSLSAGNTIGIQCSSSFSSGSLGFTAPGGAFLTVYRI